MASVQSPHPYLTEGRRVRVLRGPLAGFEGAVVRRKKRVRFVISVEMIQRAGLSRWTKPICCHSSDRYSN
jgi:hypothetical protein